MEILSQLAAQGGYIWPPLVTLLITPMEGHWNSKREGSQNPNCEGKI